MEILDSRINTSSAEFRDNVKHYQMLVNDFKGKLAEVYMGGGQKRIDLHRSRGKMLARERIEAIIDPNTPVLEFSTLAAYNMYKDKNGEWKSSQSFGRNEIPLVRYCLDKAFGAIIEEQSGDSVNVEEEVVD